jgi:hypothetical protein
MYFLYIRAIAFGLLALPIFIVSGSSLATADELAKNLHQLHRHGVRNDTGGDIHDGGGQEQ